MRRREVVDVEDPEDLLIRAHERRAHRAAHALDENRFPLETLVGGGVVRQNRDPLFHGFPGDRLRYVLRGARIAAAALGNAGDQLVRLPVEQQNRHAVDVHDLEREVHHLVEQTVELLLLRQFLRDLEQQRQLLLAPFFLSLGAHLEVRGALRLVHDDRRDAARDRQLPHDRPADHPAFDAGLGAREVGGSRHDLRPRHRHCDLFDPKRDLPEGHDVVGARFGLRDLGAVQERSVRGAEVGDADAALGQHDFGVTAGDRGIVDGDVARDGAPHHEFPPELEIDRLFAGSAQQLEHRPRN